MASTDLHMNLLGYDYYSDRVDPSIGLSRTATLIAKARDEATGFGAATLLLDNGDALQGAPLGDQFNAAVAHPLMRAFHLLNYDAIGLGNHDFNFGIKTLDGILRDAPCPVICSNMTSVSPETQLPFVTSAVLERRIPAQPEAPPVRIGLLSVLPEQTLQWDAHQLKGRVEVVNMVQAARTTSAALRADGCDVIIALAHTGVGHAADPDNSENALQRLALIDDIDVLIGGHTHLHLPDPANPFSKPVVMPGAFGSHLGVIDLCLNHGPDGWTLDGWDCGLRAISRRSKTGELRSQVAEDAALISSLAKDHAATLSRINQPVGQCMQSLHSYFTFFSPDRSLALVAGAQAAALRPLLDGSAASELPLLSAVSPCKFGARTGPTYYTDVAVGPLYRRHVADLHVFPNLLNAVTLSGVEVLEWLEMSAGLFHQVAPGSSHTELVNPDRVGHNFDVLYGLDYQIDLSVPARFHASGKLANSQAHRIRDPRWNGQPIDADQQFVVAVNSHRAVGGGNFSMVPQARQLPLPLLSIQDIIYDYLNGTLPTDPLAAAPPPWRLASLPGTQVIAYTGPGALAYLDELSHLDLDPPILTSDGFLQIKIPL
jgi:2',3'-cyclic-nucleotide 2'-phosphodiesterase/3'-nucleotidase